MRQRLVLGPALFTEIVIWQVPNPVLGSDHRLKYRLALVSDGVCVIRYDNEAGKGNHKHVGDIEVAYDFRGIEALLVDFAADIESWRQP